MKRSTDRILATHAGALPRPDDLKDMVFAKARGETYDPNVLARRLRESVAEVVRHQVECGMDFVNDGEISKTNFTNYCRERLTGFETRYFGPGEGPPPLDISGRDEKLFPEYFASGRGNTIGQAGRTQAFCVAPLTFTGEEALAADIDNLKAAVKGLDIAGTFMNANTPGTIEHWLHDEYYKNTKDFLFAIAEAMRPEYLAIVEAGFMLQIDDPDLPDGWQMFPEMSVADYRAYAQLRVDALNHALRDIPKDKVQLHVCWGSFHGPHQNDIPLADIIDIVFGVHAERFSIEASNPMHEHEWHLFEKTKLPANAVLVPGVVGHCTDFIEHPELVAERIERYAKLVGKENVVAGTDCGIGPRVGHGKIAWAKLKSIADGARIASKHLWGSAK
jgi:5-methyltetrahydropteroyltriglutamate--homocysteine methyltransferase